MRWHLWTFFLLASCCGCLFCVGAGVLFLYSGHSRPWNFIHPRVKNLLMTHFQLGFLDVSHSNINVECTYLHTLSSALRRISLSGNAPSRDIHWSRTSCGSERSCLTGTTRDPIGWSHALESYTAKGHICDISQHLKWRGQQQTLNAIVLYCVLYCNKFRTFTFMMSISSLGLCTLK